MGDLENDAVPGESRHVLMAGGLVTPAAQIGKSAVEYTPTSCWMSGKIWLSSAMRRRASKSEIFA